MKKVKFRWMLIQNFKSFQGEHTLRLDQPGVWFVRGRNKAEPRLGANGVGKSSIWDALVWCLTGQTPAGLRNPDVQPWRGGHTRVSTFVSVNGKKHKIARTIKPNTLKIDGKDVGPEAVEQLLGLPFPLLTNTIVLGQGRPLFFDLKPAEKMELLSDAKQLERWDQRSERARDTAKKLETIAEEISGEIIALRSSIEELRTGRKNTEAQEADWRKDAVERRKKDEAFRKGNQKRLDELEREVAKYDLKYDSAMTEVKACEVQINKLRSELSRADTSIAVKESRKRQTERRIEQLEEHIAKLNETKTCPTCGQKVQRSNLAEHRAEVLTELHQLRERMKKFLLKRARRTQQTIAARLKHEESYLAAFHAKADSALFDHKRYQNALFKLKEDLRPFVEQENPHTRMLRIIDKRLRTQRDTLDEQKEEYASVQKQLVKAQYWTKAFKQIKLYIIEELLQELEITTMGMMEEVGLVGWRIKYQMERETKSGKTKPGLNILIKSPKSRGKFVKWAAWSGGEGQRLRLVGALSLSSVLLNHAGIEPSLEILDEPTQHLSDRGIADLCDYLADRSKTVGRTVFYSDHNAVDSARFAGTITVARDKAGSRLIRPLQPAAGQV